MELANRERYESEESEDLIIIRRYFHYEIAKDLELTLIKDES